MVSDPIGDMLIQVKNAGLSGRRVVELPHSKTKAALARVLLAQGYLSSVEVRGELPKQKLVLGIKYENSAPAITDVKRMSKPGLRWYVNRHSIPRVVGGMGIAVISTPQGLMSGVEARKLGLGGELLCTVW